MPEELAPTNLVDEINKGVDSLADEHGEAAMSFIDSLYADVEEAIRDFALTVNCLRGVMDTETRNQLRSHAMELLMERLKRLQMRIEAFDPNHLAPTFH